MGDVGSDEIKKKIKERNKIAAKNKGREFKYPLLPHETYQDKTFSNPSDPVSPQDDLSVTPT